MWEINYTVTKVNAATASYSVYLPVSSGKRNISAVFLLKIIYLIDGHLVDYHSYYVLKI